MAGDAAHSATHWVQSLALPPPKECNSFSTHSHYQSDKLSTYICKADCFVKLNTGRLVF